MTDKEFTELSQRSFKLGQINGKAFVINRRLQNLVSALDFDFDGIEKERIIEVLNELAAESQGIMNLVKKI